MISIKTLGFKGVLTAILVLLGRSSGASEAQRIAATGAVTPDGASTFADFSAPAHHEGRIVFRANTSSGRSGIYSWSGGFLVTIADTFDDAPGGGWFTAFGSAPDTSEQRVAFQGTGTRSLFGPSFPGIYQTGDAGPFVIASSSSEVPGGSGTFVSFGPAPRIRPGGVLFTGSSTIGQGLYLSTYVSRFRVADATTPMPGHTETFARFLGPDLDESTVVFVGESASGFRGIYAWRDGVLSRVVDATTPRPDGGGAFGALGAQVGIRNGTVVFTSGTGIYTSTDGRLATIMNFQMNPPLGEHQFDAVLEGVETDGEAVVFAAASSSRRGIYVGNGGNLWTVLDNSTLLDGKAVHSFTFGNQALRDQMLAFGAAFTDGTSAVYSVRAVRVPVGSWLNTVQPLRLGGSGGYQVLHYNFDLGTSFVTPYATAPARATLPFSRGQWVGAYLYNYSLAGFSEASYRYASSQP